MWWASPTTQWKIWETSLTASRQPRKSMSIRLFFHQMSWTRLMQLRQNWTHQPTTSRVIRLIIPEKSRKSSMMCMFSNFFYVGLFVIHATFILWSYLHYHNFAPNSSGFLGVNILTKQFFIHAVYESYAVLFWLYCPCAARIRNCSVKIFTRF